jgi:hypothetical protein
MPRIKSAAAFSLHVLALVTYLAAGSQNGYPQPTGSASLAVGTIGAQVLGRVLIQSDLSVKLYGYFTYMQGVPGPIFSGAPSESTAIMTFSADPTAATLVPNGDVTQGLENPVNGQFTNLNVYYNPNPSSRNLLNPDDFTQGQLVAQFHSRAAAVSITAPATFQATGALTLQTANYFIINNQPISLFNLVSGLTLTLSGHAPPINAIAAGILANGSFSIPLSGTAYIAGIQN